MEKSVKWMFISAISMACVAIIMAACSHSSSGSSTPASTSTTSSESQTVAAVATAFDTTGSSSTGILSGTGATSSATYATMSLPTSFSTTADCANSGDVNSTLFPTNQTTGWALARIYCNLMMRPDGPDTVRGGVDRTYGLLCALGSLTYDGTEHDQTITIDSTCFSSTFIATACSSASSCSYTAKVTAYTSDQYSAAGYTTPSGFNKVIGLQVTDSAGDSLYNTIALMDNVSGERGIAINYELPGGLPSASNSVLAVYMDANAGVLRYEGRFAGNNDYVFRHIRVQVSADIDASTYAVSNIGNIQFLEGDNFSTQNGSAFYVSMKGTATAGREIGYAQNTYSSGSWGSWTTAGEDATCYPNSAGCSAGKLSLSDEAFITSSTTTDTWFASDSLLQNVSLTVPTTDLWN